MTGRQIRAYVIGLGGLTAFVLAGFVDMLLIGQFFLAYCVMAAIAVLTVLNMLTKD